MLSFRRMAAIGRVVAAEDGPVSTTLRDLLHHPLLWLAIQTRVAIALGIIFLMTVKPGLGGGAAHHWHSSHARHRRSTTIVRP
jgi:hypothetical protein